MRARAGQGQARPWAVALRVKNVSNRQVGPLGSERRKLDWPVGERARRVAMTRGGGRRWTGNAGKLESSSRNGANGRMRLIIMLILSALSAARPVRPFLVSYAYVFPACTPTTATARPLGEVRGGMAGGQLGQATFATELLYIIHVCTGIKRYGISYFR